jgi:hypothetical protein
MTKTNGRCIHLQVDNYFGSVLVMVDEPFGYWYREARITAEQSQTILADPVVKRDARERCGGPHFLDTKTGLS